jgi:hypothetical protein
MWLLAAGCLRLSYLAEQRGHEFFEGAEMYADSLTSEEVGLVDGFRLAVQIAGNQLPISPAVVFRCIFGNPFRQASVHQDWRTSTVVSLAKGIYETHNFSMMPILGDAFQDAGCEQEEVLAHCYGQGLHARGCWVVDQILGKK